MINLPYMEAMLYIDKSLQNKVYDEDDINLLVSFKI